MKKYFLTGLVTLLPLAVTLWVVHFVVNFLTKPFIGIFTALLHQFPIGLLKSEQWIRIISQIAILIDLFLFTFFLGFVARKFFFNGLLRFGDRLLHKIPLVNKVYKTTKEIIQALFRSTKNSFKQVVLIPFPYKGSYCIGLITQDSPLTCSNSQDDKLISVFIPTTPNPTSGFLVMARCSELIPLEMRSEDAIKYVVSCAVIQPEQRKHKK